jgi:hypothetical protein
VTLARSISAADPTLWGLAAELSARRAAIELELVASILSEPVCGVRYAQSAGLQPHHFDMPDLRILYCAAELLSAWGTGAVLRLARRALWDEGHYSSYAPADSRGMEWSDDSLVGLALSYPGPAMVPHLAHELIRIYRQLHAASDHLGRARKVLGVPKQRVFITNRQLIINKPEVKNRGPREGGPAVAGPVNDERANRAPVSTTPSTYLRQTQCRATLASDPRSTKSAV